MNDIERQLCLMSLARKHGENKTIHDRLETLEHVYGWKNFHVIVKPVIEKYVIGSNTDVIV